MTSYDLMCGYTMSCIIAFFLILAVSIIVVLIKYRKMEEEEQAKKYIESYVQYRIRQYEHQKHPIKPTINYRYGDIKQSFRP